MLDGWRQLPIAASIRPELWPRCGSAGPTFPLRELEPSLQQFGEVLWKAHLVRRKSAPLVVRRVRRFLSGPATDESVADQLRRFWVRSTTIGDGQVAKPGLLPQ